MKNHNLKKTVIFSFLGHLTFFSIFSLSFGSRIPSVSYAPVNFLGEAGVPGLNNPPLQSMNRIKQLFIRTPEVLKPAVTVEEARLLSDYHLKPQAIMSIIAEKEVFAKKTGNFEYAARKKEPAIILHPILPYDFTLYFKDRQIAHVELMFNLMSNGNNAFTVVKRKISSGNLEVDLLSSRYIERYLFIQHANFVPNTWRSVKIDLSAKND